MRDAVATMGEILPDDAGGRDAVHVAVFSAISDEKLWPRQDVGIVSQDGADVDVAPSREHIGIVDPFLRTFVAPGQRFWVYLYPRTITGLTHRWTHPAFEETETTYSTPNAKAASEKWLRNFIKSADCPSYEAVLVAASRVAFGACGSDWDEEHLHFQDMDAHGEIPDEFWNHVEVVLGQPIKGPRAKYFSCSC